jgi:hypothetical protein
VGPGSAAHRPRASASGIRGKRGVVIPARAASANFDVQLHIRESIEPQSLRSGGGAHQFVNTSTFACYQAARQNRRAPNGWRYVMRKLDDFENLPSFQHHA